MPSFSAVPESTLRMSALPTGTWKRHSQQGLRMIVRVEEVTVCHFVRKRGRKVGLWNFLKFGAGKSGCSPGVGVSESSFRWARSIEGKLLPVLGSGLGLGSTYLDFHGRDQLGTRSRCEDEKRERHGSFTGLASCSSWWRALCAAATKPKTDQIPTHAFLYGKAPL